MNNFLFLR